MNITHREQLIRIFHRSIAAVQGERCVTQWLAQHPIKGPVHLIAVGKAAASMARGALNVLPGQIEEGLLITKTGHCDAAPGPGIKCLEAAHPLPDESSLEAGRQLLHFVQAMPLHSQALVLISGGASSLVEVLPQEIPLADWRLANQWLLGHGCGIEQINFVRKRLSCIKAGRLAQYFADRRIICLLISDVPGDDPATIGSGLLVAERTPPSPVREWPAELTELMRRAPPLPDANDPRFRSIVTSVVATLADAKEAAAQAAREEGLQVFLHPEFIAGEAVEVGRALAKHLLQGPAGLHIWGGETTVHLPDNPGRGGRNQSLALATAEVLEGAPGVWLLSAGTDGTDGPGDYAGALVDGGSAQRGLRKLGFHRSLADYLARADAGAFLEASGDLLRTGPTGTNVMDLILGLSIAV